MIAQDQIRRWADDDLSVNLRSQWVEHIGGLGSSQFPRDIGTPNRWSVSNVSGMVQTIDSYRQNSNCYVQVNSDIQQDAGVWDSCYIDLDAPMPFDPDEGTREDRWETWEEKMEDVHWEMQKYTWFLESQMDTHPRVYYSGSRGFSIHIDFPKTKADWGALRTTVLRTLDEAGVNQKYVDTCVLEPNRIARLPYTLNWNHMEKRGLSPMLCLPVRTDWSWGKTKQEITQIETQVEVERNESKEIAHLISNTEEDGDYESRDISHNEADMNPEDAMEKVRTLMSMADKVGDGRHRILHFILVPALIEAGWEDTKQIHSMCEEFISETGANYRPTYHNHVEKSIERTLTGPPGSDSIWKPWDLDTFLQKNPELLRFI